MDFCHLHVHSDYSLLDGTAPVDDLVRTAKERGLSTIALTDHGSLSGAIAFYKAGKKHGVKPILGLETYMAPGARTDRKKDPVTGVSSFHLTLLARNLQGYHNLMALSSAAFTEGFYYNPRIDKELLAKHSEGLIVLSGCFKGETSWYLRNGNRDRAYETAEWYRGVFGENYFVEIQRNGTEGQEPNNQDLVKMARELKVPLVCTNDVHYLSKDDALAQEIRMAISTQKTLKDEDRLKHKSSEFFLRSGDEMSELFADFPEAVANTLEIARRCDVALEFGKFHLPHFQPPEGHTPSGYFGELCRKGLAERYGDPPPANAISRLEYEMGVIEKMGFTSYFLIVWDFIRYAREHGVPVGPGRGSAAGSIVAYSLRITDVCPLRHDLLFERFLNSERISMPDIDIDFCRDGRAEVIRYVTEKYGGSENVSQIITFGTMAARAVLRDVGRALDVPLAEIDVIAKKVPGGPGVTLGGAIDGDPELKTLREDPRYRELFEVSLKLEGLNRHASTHAAGVVVGDGPLRRHVPLAVVGGTSGDVVTQYTMEYLEEIGLLKMDFLGLKTLTVLDAAVRLVAASGTSLDLRHLPEGDEKTYKLLQRGEAIGVFQLESGGMRDLLVKLKPDRFEDLIALVALYRPGPLQTGMVDQFVRRKHGEEEVAFLHPALEPLLSGTYGTFVYQEQIMLVAQRVAGFTLNEADGLRKAMGKKKLDQMLKYKQQFVDGCVKNAVPHETATQIWDVMEPFAEYAFNKSHSTAYAVITYQTAFLKANHPVEFMAAVMTCDMGTNEKLVPFIDECRRMGLAVLPPDVNRSGVGFTVEDQPARRAIRFGLAAVRGVGEGAAQAIVEARSRTGGLFPSLGDFCEAIDLAQVNRAALDALVRAGGLDALGEHRAQIAAGLEPCLEMAAAAQEDKKAGQMSLFGGAPAAGAAPAAAARAPDLPTAERWPETQVLAYEKETLGIYMSSHPLARHERPLRAFATHPLAGLAAAGTGTRVRVAGMVAHLKTQFPKTGRNVNRKFARFRMEEFDGSVGCVMFADQYEEAQAILANEAIGFVEGTLDLTREEPDVKVDRFIPIEKAYDDLAEALVVVPPPGEEPRVVPVVQRICREFPGKAAVLLEMTPAPGVRARYKVECGGVRPCRELHDLVAAELGEAALRWKSKKVAPGRQQQRAWASAGD
jgi:DNA polymerase-3 subunit alpha